MPKNDINMRPSLPTARLLAVHLFKGPARRVASVRSEKDEELMVMLGGQYRAWSGGEAKRDTLLEASAGDVIYWPMGVKRLEESVQGRPMRCIAIYLRWKESLGLAPILVRDRDRVITLLANRLLTLRHVPVEMPPGLPDSYLAAMLAELLRNTLAQTDTLVGRVARYVDLHMEESFSLKDLAHDIGLDRHHFGRRFKAVTGLTPMDYVRRRKADHALNSFLADNRRTPGEIARKVGVRDVCQVRRLLQRYYGISYRDIKAGLCPSRGRKGFPGGVRSAGWLSPITAGLV